MLRLEQQHAIEKERSRIAKDIHDDVGASLTQITLLSELAKSDLEKPEQAEEHIRQISSTAREVTRCMDEIVWAVNPQNDTLEDLISYTTKSAHDYLQIARVRFRLDLPNSLPPVVLTTETRHNVFLVVREALNNVVKHAHATEVWLRVAVRSRCFTIAIEDNGMGMARAKMQTQGDSTRIAPGNGLKNMRKRLEDIGGELLFEEKPEGGLIVRLQVPCPAPALGAGSEMSRSLS
jgi:signal transduction histidine kinase